MAVYVKYDIFLELTTKNFQQIILFVSSARS